MYQILYTSNAVNRMSEDELSNLLSKAKQNNAKLDITGMLVYNDGSFIQILEGDKQTIKALLKTIIADPRHNNLIIIDESSISERSFSSWDMGFRHLTDSDIQNHPILKPLLQKTNGTAPGMINDVVDTFLHLAKL